MGLDGFCKHLNAIEMPKLDILPIILPSSDVKRGCCKVECVYPRFSFEYEEKEAANIQEIILKLEERLRMEL
jgi:hypothetical protein